MRFFCSSLLPRSIASRARRSLICAFISATLALYLPAAEAACPCWIEPTALIAVPASDRAVMRSHIYWCPPFKLAKRTPLDAHDLRLIQGEAEKFEPTLRDVVAIVDDVGQHVIAGTDPSEPPTRTAQEMPVMILHHIRP